MKIAVVQSNLFFVLVVFYCFGVANSAKIRLKNYAGAPINIFWVNLKNELSLQNAHPIQNNSRSDINSYHGHEFIIQWEYKSPEDQTTSVSFVHGEFDEEVTIRSNLDGSLTLEQTDLLREIFNDIKTSMKNCTRSQGLNAEDDDAFLLCTSRQLIPKRIEARQKLEFYQKFQSQVARKLRNYTCADESMETSPELRSYIWTDKQKDVKVNVLLDEKAAKIFHLQNFVTPEECIEIINKAKDRLTAAAVTGEDGKAVVSDYRRAKSADVPPVWDDLSHPITVAYERVYAFMRTNTLYNLSYDGQEPFNVIQYGLSDEYREHCDGSCDGSFHKIGGRVATMVLYCQTATRGGGTGFPKVDIYVKPKPYDAVFFTYRDLEGKMDTGLTEHTGCPVIEGSKWISTHWFRDGVSLANDWRSYEPSGGLYSHLTKNQVQIDSSGKTI